MIIFDLACSQDHQFEGWFKSQEDYDSQLSRGFIACPYCNATEVRRVPSAVHLAKPANGPAPTVDAPVIQTQTGMLTAYRQLVSAMMSNCEDVGKGFAEEARKIHYQAAPERSIRGEASAADYEALREEGIEVLRLPVVKNEDLN
jgi:hypothetical protein